MDSWPWKLYRVTVQDGRPDETMKLGMGDGNEKGEGLDDREDPLGRVQ
jgi:hypothetical protein